MLLALIHREASWPSQSRSRSSRTLSSREERRRSYSTGAQKRHWDRARPPLVERRTGDGCARLAARARTRPRVLLAVVPGLRCPPATPAGRPSGRSNSPWLTRGRQRRSPAGGRRAHPPRGERSGRRMARTETADPRGARHRLPAGPTRSDVRLHDGRIRRTDGRDRACGLPRCPRVHPPRSLMPLDDLRRDGGSTCASRTASGPRAR